jgi:hypothetical protein
MAKKPPPTGYPDWKSYWNYKKDVGEKYGSYPEGTYTVDIPGLQDIFKYQNPKSYSKQQKYERYLRFKTKSSPVPSAFNWIPGVMNQLDDAQDLMYTALVLAKPLLRRLPTRFIPYIGWALLIMDLLNLGTKILGLAMTPGLQKPCLRKTIRKYRKPKKLLFDLFRDFLSPGGWRKSMAFLLQAPQAAVTLTGYGMQLGTIMGAVSDSIWGGIRALGGGKVTFRAPPPSDPTMKAYRYLNQANAYANQKDILTADEHVMLIVAHQVAVGIILDSGVSFSDARCNTLMDTEVPVYEPWELSTLEVLEEVGHPIDEDIIPYSNRVNPTYGQLLYDNLEGWYSWERNLRDVFSEYSDEYSSMVYLIYQEASNDMLEAVTGVPWDTYMEDYAILKAAYELAACNIMPWRPPSNAELARFLNLAYTLAESLGKEYPGCNEFREAGQEIWGTMINKTTRVQTNYPPGQEPTYR